MFGGCLPPPRAFVWLVGNTVVWVPFGDGKDGKGDGSAKSSAGGFGTDGDPRVEGLLQRLM